MQLKYSLEKFGIKQVINWITKNPEKNLPRLMEWVDRFANGEFVSQRDAIRGAIMDPDHVYHQLILHLAQDTDVEVLKTTFINFFLNANLVGWDRQQAYRDKYNCNVPWAILLDPTSACNLHCTGCWAAEYGNKLNLSFDDLDRVVTQAKELGIHFFMFTGGEPLVRKNDLIKLCEKHQDCAFHAYTNGTLIDDAFCKELQRVGNFSFSISLEGFEAVNDSRRGAGDFEKVEKAMKLLKEYGIFFGTSICYTRANIETVTSDEFLDMLIERGCRFSWYFHYMPVGNAAAVELLPTPEQREYMYHRIREIRANEGGKQIYVMDFQNDGEFVGGCIAGGRNYCHINANGDMEPCVFIHYSSANIHNCSVLEALQQPLFMEYRARQPFNQNELRPCPMLENPEMLQEMVKNSGAKSTDLQSPESAEHLCGKCQEYAANWKVKADEIWANNPHHKQYYENYRK